MTAHLALPIDPLLPELCAQLKQRSALVLQASPGAGKTTRVPRALLEAGLAGEREVVVLEPRRLATRMAAQRVAEEMGEPLGQRVGYQVRFEDVSGPRTRLRFVTEGVLGRRLISEPTLPSVGVVVLDEFHERHLAGDLSLALLRRLQGTQRPDLKLLVMSATLEPSPLSRFLGDCPVLSSEGRRFDVTLEHATAPDERRLEQRVAGVLKRVASEQTEGHILVFLPGAAEIRKARDACSEFATRHGFEVLPLHGDLSPTEQDRAVRPSAGRKLILSTNVAETSVTIDGVTAVIDSGLARVASYSPWSGLPSLGVAKISRASATQRAGRAGRTRAGTCVRLYTRHDFETRPEHDAPEIRRTDLTETVLSLRCLGVSDVTSFPFYEPPLPASLEAAELLLRRLHAVDAQGQVTALGRRLVRLPLHPRLGRVMLEGEQRGLGEEAALLAALLSERDIRLESRAQLSHGGPGRGASAVTSGPSDLLEMMERFEGAVGGGRASSMGLDPQAVQAVERVRKQLQRTLTRTAGPPSRPQGPAREEALLQCLLSGYPDRVAKRRRAHGRDLLMFEGGAAQLAESSVVQEPELLVAHDAELRGTGRQIGVTVRLASRVEPEWLLELLPESLSEVDALVWNGEATRVERVTRMSYGSLILEETRKPATPAAAVSQLLSEAALAQGVERFVEPEAWARWCARLTLLGKAYPEEQFPAPDAAYLQRTVRAAAEGLRSFKELEDAQILSLAFGQLTPSQQRLLSSYVPDRLTLPGGRALQVHYDAGKPPWVESRLQDFFGMAQGPSVCQGRVPVVIHLLAPNHRAVQVTTDLAGFWERHYPGIRKELVRKYPRHPWPEDPLSAQPPAPRTRG